MSAAGFVYKNYLSTKLFRAVCFTFPAWSQVYYNLLSLESEQMLFIGARYLK